MRKRKKAEVTVDSGRAAEWASAIVRHPREFAGIFMAAFATLAIFTNALFLQNGPHPTPIFVSRSLLAGAFPQSGQPNLFAPNPASETGHSQLIADIQRELVHRGFYDGTVDGIWGAKTDIAARDFVNTTGAKTRPEASNGLLRAILGSNAKKHVAASSQSHDPIAAMIAPSSRVLAVQRALTDFGYGQIKPTGVYDQETQLAIAKFERERRLPVTSKISDDLVRELAAVTGRPLE